MHSRSKIRFSYNCQSSVNSTKIQLYPSVSKGKMEEHNLDFLRLPAFRSLILYSLLFLTYFSTFTPIILYSGIRFMMSSLVRYFERWMIIWAWMDLPCSSAPTLSSVVNAVTSLGPIWQRGKNGTSPPPIPWAIRLQSLS